MPALNTNDYAYIIPPSAQFNNENGDPYSAGYVEFYLHGTSEKYYTYADWTGSLNPFRIPLNSQGRAVAIAEKDVLLDMYVYNWFGNLAFTRLNVQTSEEGGGAPLRFTSSDGSIIISRSGTTVDLQVKRDTTKYGGATADSEGDNGLIEFDTVNYGEITLDEDGQFDIMAGKLYHVTLHLAFNTTTLTGSYVDCKVTDSENTQHKFYLDGSRSTQYADISWDFETSHTYLRFYVTAPGFELTSAELYLHAVNPVVGGGEGGGTTYTAGDGINISQTDVISADFTTVQPKLTAGSNIVIDPSTNTISATAEPITVDSAMSTTSENPVQNKVITAALNTKANSSDLATVAFSGNYNDLSNKPDIPSQQVQSDWTETETSDPAYIKHKPENLVQDANYVHTDNNYTTADKNKLDGVESGAQVNVNADWNASSGDAQILNKPNLATVATSGDYDDLINKPTIPAAQVNSDWNASSGVAQILNKPNLATVATSGSYNDLIDKPTIPTVPVQGVEVDGVSVVNANGIAEIDLTGKVDKVSGKDLSSNDFTDADVAKLNGIEAGAQVNVQANWTETNSSSDAYIQNKPTLATVATTGDYDDLTNKPSIPAAQVNSDWNASSGVAEILHKPDLSVYAQIADLAAVAFSGDYDDLTDTPDLSAFARSADLAAIATSGSWNDLSNVPSDLVEDPSYVHTDENFTTAEKTKLAGIEAGAEVNVQADWSQSDNTADDYIKNKPERTNLIAGSGITITQDASGTTIAASFSQVQSDWNQSNSSAVDYIKNKPSVPLVSTVTL